MHRISALFLINSYNEFECYHLHQIHTFFSSLSLSAAWYAFHYSTISHLENSNDDNSKNEMKETLSLFLSKYFLILYVIMQIVIIFHSWSIVDKMLRT